MVLTTVVRTAVVLMLVVEKVTVLETLGGTTVLVEVLVTVVRMVVVGPGTVFVTVGLTTMIFLIYRTRMNLTPVLD